MKPIAHIPNPPYARVMGRLVDRRIGFIDRLRVEAILRLQLQPGHRVIDGGCGTGASFPYLISQVGASGEVVGVELSPFLAERARRHIQENGWNNVQVLEAPAQTVELSGKFDALLLFAAHEILTSSEALDHLLSHLKDQATVVAFGAKRTAPPLGWLFNPFFGLVSKQWLRNSAPIDSQPWRLLITRFTQIRVEQHLGGLMYLVSGIKHTG